MKQQMKARRRYFTTKTSNAIQYTTIAVCCFILYMDLNSMYVHKLRLRFWYYYWTSVIRKGLKFTTAHSLIMLKGITLCTILLISLSSNYVTDNKILRVHMHAVDAIQPILPYMYTVAIL